MMRSICHLSVALLLLVAAPSAAEAGVPIPCTGESIVKVLDIPSLAQVDVDAQGRRIERRFDLGYKFSGCFGGEWVAHVGSDHKYVTVGEAKLQQMLRAAGRSELPPAPSFWSSGNSIPVYIWLGILTVGAIGAVLSKSKERVVEAAPTGTLDEGAIEVEPNGRWAAAAARMEAGLREQEVSAAAAPTIRVPSTREPTDLGRGHIGTPVFGRRH